MSNKVEALAYGRQVVLGDEIGGERVGKAKETNC